MATFDLPAAPDGTPSNWDLLPMLNVEAFRGGELTLQRNLRGGSRFLLRMNWDHRHGERRRKLAAALMQASVPGHDLRVGLAALGHVPPPNVTVVAGGASDLGGGKRGTPAGATELSCQVTGNLPAFSILSHGDRLLLTLAAATGNATLTLAWALRAPIEAGQSIEVANPTARFVNEGDAPSFPTLGRTVAGEERGPLAIELVEAL